MFLIRAAGTVPGPDTPCVLTGYGGFAVTMGPATAPRSWPSATTAASTRWPTSGAAPRRARPGTGPACASTSSRCSTTSSPPPTGWWPKGSPAGHGSPSAAAATAACSMGAAITQRPDLCRAAQIAVPLLDMVRYPQFLIAQLWIPEYGDPDGPTSSPGSTPTRPTTGSSTAPATRRVLLTTAEDDSRVAPLHARKMAARLAEATSCGDDPTGAAAGGGPGRPRPGQAGDQPGRRAGRRPRLPVVAARSGGRGQLTGLTAPNRPCDSSFGPAVNSSVLVLPATPLPNRSPHRPSMMMGWRLAPNVPSRWPVAGS